MASFDILWLLHAGSLVCLTVSDLEQLQKTQAAPGFLSRSFLLTQINPDPTTNSVTEKHQNWTEIRDWECVQDLEVCKHEKESHCPRGCLPERCVFLETNVLASLLLSKWSNVVLLLMFLQLLSCTSAVKEINIRVCFWRVCLLSLDMNFNHEALGSHWRHLTEKCLQVFHFHANASSAFF